MSSSVYWRPTSKDNTWVDKEVWYALKVLNKGSAPTTLTKAHERDLRALAIGNVAGAEDLLMAIERHGEIDLAEVF